MNEKLDRGRQQSVLIPEYFAKILKNKDRIIRVQARRIEILEEEVHRLRMAREAMGAQLAVLSCRLRVLSARNDVTGHGSDSRVSGLQLNQMKHQALDSNAKRTECKSNQRRTNRNGPVDTRPTESSNHLIPFYGSTDLEMLEEKYGDYAQANRAALKIQHMYRQYSLNRNFQKLRLEAGDSSRRSRRFTKLAAEHNLKTASGDVAITDRPTTAGKNASGPKLPNRGLENGEYAKRNSRSPDSNSLRTLTTVVAQLPRQRDPPVASSDRTFKASVDRYFEGEDVKDFRNGSGSVSPRNTAAANTLDLPSFDFESLLESQNKTPTLFCENSQIDGSYSSSSSSSKVSTPVDSTPNITYIGKDCLRNSNEISEALVPFKSKDTNYDPNLPLRTLDGLVSCDYDNMYVSVPSSQPNNLYSSSLSDGVRHHHRPDNPPSGQSSGKSSRSSNQGHYNHGHKLSLERPRACNHADLKSSGSTCGDAKLDIAEVENAMFSLSREHRASSSGSDVASLGSSNDTKVALGGFNGDISSGEFELYARRNNPHLSDKQRKRKYRIGLNLFNRKPMKGIRFLIENSFLDNRPRDVARFLVARKGLSKQMIGEYLGNLLQQFNMDVLECFVSEIDFAGISIDKALRKFQSHFRMPGEAQKIEKLMEAFASSYITSNPDVVRKFSHPDTVFLIAYAIIMLNTDLHNSSIKPDRKMKLQDFIRNLRGIDGGEDVDPELLSGIFDRIATYPLKPANDHVVQVMKVEKMILGKKPLLPEPHRRLICYCRLYEVKDPSKREKPNMHQREVFLFNDLLLIAKLNNKKKDSLLYNYRESFHLFGMMIALFELQHYKHGVQLTSNLDNRVLVTLCASNEADRVKFVEDLNEAIIEVNEMESLQVQEEFAAHNLPTHNFTDILRRSKDPGALDRNPNRLSVSIVENRLSAPDCIAQNKSSPSPSNGDVVDGKHRLSSGSLDSGLPSVNSGSSNSSFQVPDRSVQKSRDASKFNIFARKPKTIKSSAAEST